MDNYDVALYYINKGITHEAIANQLNIPIKKYIASFHRTLTNGEKKDIIKACDCIVSLRNEDARRGDTG